MAEEMQSDLHKRYMLYMRYKRADDCLEQALKPIDIKTANRESLVEYLQKISKRKYYANKSMTYRILYQELYVAIEDRDQGHEKAISMRQQIVKDMQEKLDEIAKRFKEWETVKPKCEQVSVEPEPVLIDQETVEQKDVPIVKHKKRKPKIKISWREIGEQISKELDEREALYDQIFEKILIAIDHFKFKVSEFKLLVVATSYFKQSQLVVMEHATVTNLHEFMAEPVNKKMLLTCIISDTNHNSTLIENDLNNPLIPLPIYRCFDEPGWVNEYSFSYNFPYGTTVGKILDTICECLKIKRKGVFLVAFPCRRYKSTDKIGKNFKTKPHSIVELGEYGNPIYVLKARGQIKEIAAKLTADDLVECGAVNESTLQYYEDSHRSYHKNCCCPQEELREQIKFLMKIDRYYPDADVLTKISKESAAELKKSLEISGKTKKEIDEELKAYNLEAETIINIKKKFQKQRSKNKN